MRLDWAGLLALGFAFCSPASVVRAVDLALHENDTAVIQQIAVAAELDAPQEVNPKQGWPNLKGEPSIRFASKEGKRVLLLGHDQAGHVTKLIGNGPLLTNEAFGWLAKLPELRSIRIDHNTPAPGSGGDIERYDGSGIAALADSKLEEIKIGHAFDDDGMVALAKVKSLRIVTIGHSRATDAGVAHFRNHPNIEEFNISPQARVNRFTDKSLPVLATLPKLKRLGLHETFLSYDNGLKHLSALQGRLESVDFKGALVIPSDVEKLKADHPGLNVEVSMPAEILAAPNSRGVLKWASPEALKYLNDASHQ